MHRITCAAAAVVLLGGCSNYVSPVSSYELKTAEDLRVDTYRDGERYVRIMKDRFQAKVQQLENEENFWKLGVLGGGITTLVGVIDKHPHTALVGAGIAGGSYIYGQAFGPDVLRKIYLNGDAALNCVLVAGTKISANFSLLQKHIDAVQVEKGDLEKELAHIEKTRSDSKYSATQGQIDRFLSAERNNIKDANAALANWNIPGLTIGRRMVVTADVIRTQVNQMIKANEATLSSLYAATSAAGGLGVNLMAARYQAAPAPSLPAAAPGAARTPTDTDLLLQPARDASARLNQAMQAANADLPKLQQVSNLDQIDACTVAGIETPLLTFEPADIKVKKGAKISVVVRGGRPPYTFVAVGAPPPNLAVTLSSFSGSSGVLLVDATASTVTTSVSYDYAFSSLHPQATAQIVKVTVEP